MAADLEPPASYERRRCRWCPQLLLMARMPSGKDAPLVYEPNPEKGNVVLDGHGLGHTLTKAQFEDHVANHPEIPRYLNHHADCPNVPPRRRR